MGYPAPRLMPLVGLLLVLLAPLLGSAVPVAPGRSTQDAAVGGNATYNQSTVDAGLILPQLADDVVGLYLQASAGPILLILFAGIVILWARTCGTGSGSDKLVRATSIEPLVGDESTPPDLDPEQQQLANPVHGPAIARAESSLELRMFTGTSKKYATTQIQAVFDELQAVQSDGHDLRELMTTVGIEAALETLVAAGRGNRSADRTGQEERGVRIYNLTDEELQMQPKNLDGGFLGPDTILQPFDEREWQRCKIEKIDYPSLAQMAIPESVYNLSAGGATADHFVSGDSSQMILVFPPSAIRHPPEGVSPASSGGFCNERLLAGWDGRDGGHDLPELELVQDRGLPGRVDQEQSLEHLMTHWANVEDPSCMHRSFAQSDYLKSYNQCGRPRDSGGQWADPLGAVRSCLPQAFDLTQWDQAVAQAGAGSDLHKAGSACARLWSSGPACRLINQVIMDDDNRPHLDRMMPFVRCLNEYLYSGTALTADLTVYRTSRLTLEQAANIHADREYRFGMYVATSRTEAALAQVEGWQAGEIGAAPAVRWVFAIPAGCRQVDDLRAVSAYALEDEVLMVPYTAVRVDRNVAIPGGTTIYATVLRDAYIAPEDLPTILA